MAETWSAPGFASRGVLGAGLLAFVVLLPTAGEARFGGRQLAISEECNAQLPGREFFRTAGPCKGQALVKAALMERVAISGKVGRALAVALYCRSSTHVSSLTGVITPFLPPPPHHRLLHADGNIAVEPPPGRLEPPLDTPRVEAFLVPRLPDG